MRKMRTLFLVLLCCGLSLYAGVSYVKAEEKVPSDYDAYLQETGMPENEIQKLDEHVKQFIVDDLKNGDGKFEYMKIDVGRTGDEWKRGRFRMELSSMHQPFKLVRRFIFIRPMNLQRTKNPVETTAFRFCWERR